MFKKENLDHQTRKQILFAAENAAPYEMCGLIVHDKNYQAWRSEYPLAICRNIADNPQTEFEIASDEFLHYERVGNPVVAIVHSHPNGEPFLSGADRQAQVASGLTWILAVSGSTTGTHIRCQNQRFWTNGSLKLFYPVPHLRGREFIYDKSDCCRLIQDAYHLCGLDLPDCPRLGLDDDIAAQTLINYFNENQCFSKVSDDIQAGDIILTQFGNSTPEHAILYLGNGEMLHHAHNHLSRIENYSNYWQKHTHSVWRHEKWQPEMMAAIFSDLNHCCY